MEDRDDVDPGPYANRPHESEDYPSFPPSFVVFIDFRHEPWNFGTQSGPSRTVSFGSSTCFSVPRSSIDRLISVTRSSFVCYTSPLISLVSFFDVNPLVRRFQHHPLYLLIFLSLDYLKLFVQMIHGSVRLLIKRYTWFIYVYCNEDSLILLLQRSSIRTLKWDKKNRAKVYICAW